MRKRKLFLLLVALCLLLVCLPVSASVQDCGSFSWELEGDVLTVSGVQMPDWYEDSPWYESREQIKRVVIQDGMTNIGSFAFSDCVNLTDVTIPGSVTRIHDGAFSNCTRLERVMIPEGVGFLGGYVFAECGSLVSVSIPQSLESVDFLSVFHHCFRLTEIQVAKGNPSYATVDGLLCSADRTTLVRVPAGKTGVLALPRSIITLEHGAFYGCTGITGISFPKYLTDMGTADFSGCTGLKAVLFQGDRPDLSDVVFPPQTVVYYPAGNATWQAGAQDNGHIGGRQPWRSYDVGDPPELDPTEPPPTEWMPTEPIPTEPAPTEPIPTEPKPTEPKPTEPKPTEPKPTEPEPTQPKPTQPKPTDPEPTEQTDTKPTKPETTETKPTGSAATDDSRPVAPAPAKANGGWGILLAVLLAVLFAGGIYCGLLLYQKKKES